jgi:hypothetical protein
MQRCVGIFTLLGLLPVPEVGKTLCPSPTPYLVHCPLLPRPQSSACQESLSVLVREFALEDLHFKMVLDRSVSYLDRWRLINY